MRRRPFLFRLAGSVLLLLLVVHSAAWWWLSRQVRDGFAAWAGNERALGVIVTAGDPTLTGWPLAAGIAVPGLAMGGPGWQWTAEHASVTLRPGAPTRLHVQPSGRQALTAGPVTLGLQARSTLLTLGLADGSDPALAIVAPVLDTPFGPATAESAEFSMSANPGLSGRIEVSGLSLPPGPPYLLGPSVAELGVELDTPGPLPALDSAGLAAWRNSGGIVRLDAVHLHWGPLILDAAGTAGLDRSLQPLADVRVRMSGQDAALDQAVAKGVIQPRVVLGIRAVLSLLASARPDGQAAIPASLHDGVVAIAGFPVARTPPIPWQ